MYVHFKIDYTTSNFCHPTFKCFRNYYEDLFEVFLEFYCRKAIPQILILEQSYRSSFHRKCKKFSEILYSLRDSVREKFFSNYRKTRKVSDFILVFDMESFLFYSNSGYHSACWFCSIPWISISIIFLLNKHFVM